MKTFNLLPKQIWEPCLKVDVLTLACVYKRFSDKKYDSSGFRMRDSLTTFSLGWKLLMFMKDPLEKPIYKISHRYRRWYVWQSLYGRKVGANFKYFEPAASTEIGNVIS